MASEIKVDTISEKTSAGGVTIDGLLIKDGGISGDVSLIGTTPTFTIGDAGAEDAALVFDGNAKDFYVALDDSADKLVIGEGSTVGTNSILTITDDSVTIGDAAAVDTKIVFDGNAQDFYVGLDDSADDLVIGLGSTVGTTPAISINSDRDVTISDGAIDFDIASHDTSNGLKLGGTLVTATAAELNIMDGVGSTAAELNYSDLATLGTTAASKVFTADANNLTKITGGVYLEEATLTFDSTQDWDVRASPVAKVTLTANVTFDLPSNPTTGQYISIVCIQDGTGSRTIAWNAAFEFTGDAAPTATTTASKGDMFTFRYNGSKWLEVGRNLNLTLS